MLAEEIDEGKEDEPPALSDEPGLDETPETGVPILLRRGVFGCSSGGKSESLLKPDLFIMTLKWKNNQLDWSAMCLIESKNNSVQKLLPVLEFKTKTNNHNLYAFYMIHQD